MMRFLSLKCRTKTTFQIICNGIEKEKNAPADKLSATISAIKSTGVDATRVWDNKEIQKNLLLRKTHKKTVFVIWKGINHADWWKKSVLGPVTSSLFVIVEEKDLMSGTTSEGQKPSRAIETVLSETCISLKMESSQ
ncbi:hypothetical protein CRE_01573 [Caenorhabditis remanei]|uniref:Uncharacterized protein n=1 Tax=Caenorhabditis remanei TaxID=31234 RepID=E3LGJ6_CAERE|nr:hypothetical protein CRE_01573 [Caenorhabditis remanei]